MPLVLVDSRSNLEAERTKGVLSTSVSPVMEPGFHSDSRLILRDRKRMYRMSDLCASGRGRRNGDSEAAGNGHVMKIPAIARAKID